MRFVDPQQDPKKGVTFHNNPEGFQMPFDVYAEFEREICEWKYYRLHNQPRHLLNKRCNGFNRKESFSLW